MKDVTLSNLKMKHNSTTYSGGALYVVGTGLALQNCTFENNIAKGHGGAIGISGASVVTCENCTFPNNTGSNGGAIRIDADCNAIFTSCDFLGNNGKSGGAICAAGATSFENCTFTENTASDDGGAVWNAATFSADRCKFIGNTITSTAKNKSATIRIGGDSMFNSCEFRENESKAGTSGHIAYNSTGTNIGMHNCLLFENKGSASWSLYSSGPVYMINSTVIDPAGNAVLYLAKNTSLFCNNIVINSSSSITTALRAPATITHDYNIVSGFLVATQQMNETISATVPEGEANIQDDGMSYYSWSGQAGYTQTTGTALKEVLKGSDFGKAFYSWLDELVEGDGTALDYDIRGIARTNGYWPGSYQNN